MYIKYFEDWTIVYNVIIKSCFHELLVISISIFQNQKNFDFDLEQGIGHRTQSLDSSSSDTSPSVLQKSATARIDDCGMYRMCALALENMAKLCFKSYLHEK